MQKELPTYHKVYNLWYGADLSNTHGRRVQRALMLLSATMVLVGLAWGAFFYHLDNWPVVALDLLLVVGGLATASFIWQQKPELATATPFVTLFIVIGAIAWAFDSATPQAPRTTQLYLMPLSVAAMLAFRTSRPWLRFGAPGICLLALGILSLGYGSPFPQYALPESIKATGAIVQTVTALSLFFIILHVMQHDAIVRSALEIELLQALECSEFRLFYQPQLDSLGHVIGAEALLRWQHPERGLIAPGEFLETAEQSGLILPIGKWVARQACEQLRSWSQVADFKQLRVAINISQVQIRQNDFVPQIQSLIEEYQIPANQLELEITESMLVDDMQEVVKKMNALHQCGVTFSLDDFGTGYSSLNHLKSLPLQQLKIDQSFVRDVVSNSSDASIIRTVIALGHNLDMTVIAEGVETREQHQFLIDSGCELFQGYLFSKALPIDEFNAYVRSKLDVGAGEGNRTLV